MSLSADEKWMQVALDAARQARRIAPPNPAVGCAIVRDGQLLATGYTHHPGSDHAEIDAIRNATAKGIKLRGTTFYVTLEPCSHQGRTPPCTRSLIREGVARVVIATLDPNPLVAGRGVQQLQEAGIEVEVGVLEEEARLSNCGFLTRMISNRPWVRLKTAVSVDGQTALINGQSQWITGPKAREATHQLRAESQAILTGIGTVLADNPQMNVRLPGINAKLTKYVLDTHGRCPLSAKIFEDGSPVVIFVGTHVSDEKVQALLTRAQSVRRVPETDQGLDLNSVMTSIGADSINLVHVEAGAQLSGSLIQANLVDELVVYVGACLLGSGQPLASLPQLQSMQEVRRFKLTSVRALDDDVEIRYMFLGRPLLANLNVCAKAVAL